MISFEVNNNGLMQLEQPEHDRDVTVTVWDCGDDGIREVRRELKISPGDFITMLNWYAYQKENGNYDLCFE